MSLPPEQIAKIRAKEASTPDALKRNPLNNYTEGWFHVTLNVRDESPVLGYIIGDADAPEASANAPRCALTALGKEVEKEWKGIGRYYPLCVCEAIQVMPEHLHALLHLLPGNKGHLGRIINGLMIGCTHHYWDTLGIPWREMRKELEETLKRQTGGNNASTALVSAQSKALRAQWQDRDHTRSFRGPALLCRGYNDVEAVTEEEIEIKRQYIRNNPRKRLITRSKKDRFTVKRDKYSQNWHIDAVRRGLCADRFFARDPLAMERALANIIPRLNCRTSSGNSSSGVATTGFSTSGVASTGFSSDVATTGFSSGVANTGFSSDVANTGSLSTVINGLGGDILPTLSLDYVGNGALLAAKRKLPLICHRADASRFEQQREAVLQAARDGAVIVSAFISPKEREIMKQLLQELLPVIEVVDNGFAERYKPIGKSFYAVAEERLCQITPWSYEYQRDVSVNREMCMVMNELVRVISTEKEDWWKTTSSQNENIYTI